MIPEAILNMIERKWETATVNWKEYNAERLEKFLESRYIAYQCRWANGLEVVKQIINHWHLIDDIEPQEED